MIAALYGSVLSTRTGTVSRPARLRPAKRDGPHLGHPLDAVERPIPSFPEGRQKPEPGQLKTSRSAPARRLVVLSVADVRAPGGALPLLAGFRQRQMRKQAIGRGPVPVHRIRRDVDRIARVQHLRLLAFEADAADAGQTEERLPNRVGVPRGACARRERDDRTAKARRRLGGDHRILEHNAGEGLGGASSCVARPGANDSGFYWHDCTPSSDDGLATAQIIGVSIAAAPGAAQSKWDEGAAQRWLCPAPAW